MENYRQIANQSYDIIPRDIRIQLSDKTKELRFVKVEGMKLMYDSYEMQKNDELPTLDGFDYVDNGCKEELEVIIANALQSVLPKEIRVIKPKWSKDNFGVFIKK